MTVQKYAPVAATRKPVATMIGKATRCDATGKDRRIVPSATSVSPADAVRSKLAERGVSEADVADAVAWARSTG